MGRIQALIDDFSIGEVSRLTEARLSSDVFRNGVRECTNMVPDSHGPLIGRLGFKHILTNTVSDPAFSGTVYSITYSQKHFFIAILTDLNIKVYQNGTLEILNETTIFTEKDLHGADHNHTKTQAFISPDSLTLHVLTGEHPVHSLILTPTIDASGDYTWAAAWAETAFINPPADWKAGTHPITGTYYQGRSWWGGCRDKPDTFWGSRSNSAAAGSYLDMNQQTGSVTDTSGIEFEIAKHGRITWLQGGKNLLVGTENAELIITAEARVITPSDIQADLQSAYGSRQIMSELLGTEVIYITGDARKVRSMWYKWVESGWVSYEASFNSEHMLDTFVRDLAFARNPDSILWMTLRDGDIACCSYRRQTEADPIAGFHRIQNDSLAFHSITVAENDGLAETWALVKDTTGTTSQYLLRQRPKTYSDSGRVSLDSYLEFTNVSSIDVGDHFDQARNIDIIADGFHLPDVTFVSNVYTFAAEVKSVLVGYPYIQRIRTMPMISVGGKDGSGSTTFHKKRWNKIFLRLIRSYMPKVNGFRPPERHITTHDDTAEPFINTFVQVMPGFGWDRDGILTIEQDLPFSLILTGIYGEFASENI